MTKPCVLDLTLRGVEIRDETVFFVRRCFRQLQRQLARSDERVSVLLERPDDSIVVRAFVKVGDERTPWVGYGEDPDEFLAASNAFAALEGELLREMNTAPPQWLI